MTGLSDWSQYQTLPDKVTDDGTENQVAAQLRRKFARKKHFYFFLVGTLTVYSTSDRHSATSILYFDLSVTLLNPHNVLPLPCNFYHLCYFDR